MCKPHFVKLFFVKILPNTAVCSEILPLVIKRVPGLVGVGVKGFVGGSMGGCDMYQ